MCPRLGEWGTRPMLGIGSLRWWRCQPSADECLPAQQVLGVVTNQWTSVNDQMNGQSPTHSDAFHNRNCSRVQRNRLFRSEAPV